MLKNVQIFLFEINFLSVLFPALKIHQKSDRSEVILLKN